MPLSPDSLLQVIAQKNAALADNQLLIQYLMARVDSLTADSARAAAEATKAFDVRITQGPPRGLFDWWQLVLPSGAALVAAWIGARLGASAAREAGIEAIREEAELERGHDLRLLVQRMKKGLPRVEDIATRAEKMDVGKAFDREVVEDLEVVWNLYHRHAPSIFALGDEGLSADLDDLFAETHLLSDAAKALDAWHQSIPIGSETNNLRSEVARGRPPLKDKIVALGPRAKDLRTRLDAVVLPSRTHHKRVGFWRGLLRRITGRTSP